MLAQSRRHGELSSTACAQQTVRGGIRVCLSSFTSSFTTSIAKQPTLCSTLWSASLKTHSHRVKNMVKLAKHGSLPRS
jgi:hypothetical protein